MSCYWLSSGLSVLAAGGEGAVHGRSVHPLATVGGATQTGDHGTTASGNSRVPLPVVVGQSDFNPAGEGAVPWSLSSSTCDSWGRHTDTVSYAQRSLSSSTCDSWGRHTDTVSYAQRSLSSSTCDSWGRHTDTVSYAKRSLSSSTCDSWGRHTDTVSYAKRSLSSSTCDSWGRRTDTESCASHPHNQTCSHTSTATRMVHSVVNSV